MYTISLWASRHLWLSRLTLVLCHVILGALALFIGDVLQLIHIRIPVAFFYAATVLFTGVFFSYPQKRYKKQYAHFYRFQKTCDALLVGIAFFFSVGFGNQSLGMKLGTHPASASTAIPATFAIEQQNVRAPKLHGKSPTTKKPLQNRLVQKIRALRHMYKQSSKSGKVALITVSVLVALILLFIVAAISCEIGCSGSGAVAMIVLALGAGAIIFFLVRTIRRIRHGTKQQFNTGDKN